MDPELANVTLPPAPTLTDPPDTAASAPFAVDVFITRLLLGISEPEGVTEVEGVALKVISALILMLCAAVKVNWFAFQLTAPFTLISPEPLAAAPSEERIVTLFASSCFESVSPSMSDFPVPVNALEPLGPIVKSCGSISQVPVLPCGAVVLIIVAAPITTLLADVSISPPSPPRSPP